MGRSFDQADIVLGPWLPYQPSTNVVLSQPWASGFGVLELGVFCDSGGPLSSVEAL